jgi:Tol biopolymer transport system component
MLGSRWQRKALCLYDDWTGLKSTTTDHGIAMRWPALFSFNPGLWNIRFPHSEYASSIAACGRFNQSDSNRGSKNMSSLSAPAMTLGLLLAATGVPERWTPTEISTDQYESSPTLSPDGRELFFFRADRQFDHYRLLSTRCVDGRWSSPTEPSFAAAAGVLETDPAFGTDGRRLYYGSDRHRKDDLDIWTVERTPDGGWGAPVRLPEPVNSIHSELLPRPLADGRLLFGSNRPGGPGGRDLYLATPQGDGQWRVEPLPGGVNTAGDEYEADISRDGRVMVVVANRGERSHLYRYERVDGAWRERGQVPARQEVFQVGPLLSPDGKRLLFAQAGDGKSGELFLVDLEPGADPAWPRGCD